MKTNVFPRRGPETVVKRVATVGNRLATVVKRVATVDSKIKNRLLFNSSKNDKKIIKINLETTKEKKVKENTNE